MHIRYAALPLHAVTFAHNSGPEHGLLASVVSVEDNSSRILIRESCTAVPNRDRWHLCKDASGMHPPVPRGGQTHTDPPRWSMWIDFALFSGCPPPVVERRVPAPRVPSPGFANPQARALTSAHECPIRVEALPGFEQTEAAFWMLA
jgi:hypothetical protein